MKKEIEEKKAKLEAEKKSKEESARLDAEKKKTEEEAKKLAADAERQARIEEAKAALLKKHEAEEASRRSKDDEKRLAEEKKKAEADAKQIEEEARKMVAAQEKEGGRRVVRSGATTTAAATPAAVPAGTGSVPRPAASLDDAKKDPRFQAGDVSGEAKVKVAGLAEKFPYYGIPNNGCGLRKFYVSAELVAPFDGMDFATPVVIGIQDATLGPSRAGAVLGYTGLRRAGKAPDGTMVYCGTGAANPVRR